MANFVSNDNATDLMNAIHNKFDGITPGHIIENSSGTDMPSREKLQILGATITDDSENDRTVVTISPGGTVDAADVTYHETSTVEDALDSLSTDVSGKVSKSGDTMSGDLAVNKSSGMSNIIAGGDYRGRLRLYGNNTSYYGQFYNEAANPLTSNRDYYLPDKSGTLALTSDIEEITRPDRASVSVLTYATTLSEGIHFYTTTAGTTDNPTNVNSYMFIIYKASIGITVSAMRLGNQDVYVNSSTNSGSTWSGWISLIDFISKTDGGTFGGDIAVDKQNGTTSAVGESRIYVGNATPEGTDKNSYGSVFIYSNTSYVTRLRAATNQTAHRNIYLPDKSGTLAITSDVDTKVSKSGDTMSGNLIIDRQSGTTSVIGSSAIAIGNNLPSGTDKNSRGYVELYGTGAYYARLRAGDLTANKVIDLPNANGTLALTSDIPTDFVPKSTGGTFSGDVGVDLQNGGADQNNAWSIINLGNNIPKGTVKHSAGIVRLFGHGAYRTDLQAPNATANRNIYLPDKAGTIALTSDINNAIYPFYSGSSAANITLNSQVGQGYYVILYTLGNTGTDGATATGFIRKGWTSTNVEIDSSLSSHISFVESTDSTITLQVNPWRRCLFILFR